MHRKRQPLNSLSVSSSQDLLQTPSAAPHGTKMTFPWCPGSSTASWLRAA
jgi:hypothetical protein